MGDDKKMKMSRHENDETQSPQQIIDEPDSSDTY